MAETDWWLEERIAWAEGYRCIAGIDEAGRGAMAGPVVAACVVLPYEKAPPGINDSKALTPAQRERLYDEIVRVARGVGVGIVGAEEIDRINVLRATHKAMRLALENLPGGLQPDIALIDGLPVRPFPITQVALVRGDTRSISIAAASIIAKVTRDRLMRDYDAQYPGYGFALHKGYCVPAHLRALESLGPCPLHRRSFRPVGQCEEGDVEALESGEPGATSAQKAAKEKPESVRRTGKGRRAAPPIP
ncbi:MAG TPA: ribonuclease HII [Chthonomonadaceae bacterium]|nr:ribonuclease HII [Chthonomonadaceae bacterium]